jgi:2-C-methyl-D-erythritol 4-phosphate cytidylyltransferase
VNEGLVIVAAGKGSRLGSRDDKALVPIRGRPLVTWSLLAFEGFDRIVERVVVVPPGREPAFAERALRPFGLDGRVRLVAGGDERQDSVRNGVRALGDGLEWVLVHDAARPLVTRGLIERVLSVSGGAGVVPARVPRDSVARIGSPGRLAGYEDRERLLLVQTPQRFRRPVLSAALEAAARDGRRATDEASLVLGAGHEVAVVDGDEANLKVTFAGDLAWVERVLAAREDAR